MTRPALFVALVLTATSCVYFNAMYDAERDYDRAIDQSREGREAEARVRYDSVIAITGRIIRDHPESEHAAPAAILKARAEIARQRWQAAAASAETVPALTPDSALIGIAAGLEGIARRVNAEGTELVAAERLLTRALESGPSSEDSAQFLFHRGLARLDLGDATAAAQDLEAVSAQERLSENVQLDLARALAEVGQYDRSTQLTEDLIAGSRFANFGQGMDSHLDSLVRWAPEPLAAALARQLADSDLPAPKLALLHYYRGRAREMIGDPAGALAEYDLARGEANRGRYAAEASYRWAALHIHEADRPAGIVETRQALAAARSGIPEPEVASRVARLTAAAEEFTRLVDAYETRGGTAAEAALRAAEIAGAELGARHVARGLYLQYLALAPDSPWRAKAIAGAMLYADSPAGDWADDRGADTDRRLEQQLAGLPTDDPYRVSIQDLPRSARIDSAYVSAERELRRRLVEIRMLYDTTAVLVQPEDTAGVGDQDDGEPQGEAGDRQVEF